MNIKKCYKCNVEKILTEFNRQKKAYDGVQGMCRECQKEHKMAYRYGVSADKFQQMRQEQQFSCVICKTHERDLSRPLMVDHCHASKNVRGLLCNACNVLLGQAGDKIDVLESAIQYLRKQG